MTDTSIITGGSDVTGGAARASVSSLEDQLVRAENSLLCARMIDNFARMVRESDAAQSRVDEIRRRIVERDRTAHADVERDYVRAGVVSLGDRHAR